MFVENLFTNEVTSVEAILHLIGNHIIYPLKLFLRAWKVIQVFCISIAFVYLKSPSSNHLDSLQDRFLHWHRTPEIKVLQLPKS